MSISVSAESFVGRTISSNVHLCMTGGVLEVFSEEFGKECFCVVLFVCLFVFWSCVSL